MGSPGARRTRPVSDEVLDKLRKNDWVQDVILATSAGIHAGSTLASAVNRLRNAGHPIETGTFYRLVRDPLQLELPVPVERAVNRQSDARGIRGATPNGDQLHIDIHFWEELARPRYVTFKYDSKRGVIGLKESDYDDLQVRTRRDGRKHVEITVPGLFDVLDVPPTLNHLKFSVRVRDGYILLRSDTLYKRCEQCNGKGIV